MHDCSGCWHGRFGRDLDHLGNCSGVRASSSRIAVAVASLSPPVSTRGSLIRSPQLSRHTCLDAVASIIGEIHHGRRLSRQAGVDVQTFSIIFAPHQAMHCMYYCFPRKTKKYIVLFAYWHVQNSFSDRVIVVCIITIDLYYCLVERRNSFNDSHCRVFSLGNNASMV